MASRNYKSRSSNATTSGGTGFTGLLTLLFIALKLLGYIDWSWWWVLSPLWITILCVIVAFVIGFAVALISDFINDKNGDKPGGNKWKF